MSFRALFLTAFFLLVLVLPASAQTRFFAPGQDGHSASLQTGVSGSDINLAGTYSHIWDGRLEIGLLVGHSWLDDPRAQGWFYGPALGVGLMKPEDRFPIGLELQGTFQMSDVDASNLGPDHVGYEAQIFQADAAFYGEIAASPTLTLYPTGMVSYFNGSLDLKSGYWRGSKTADVDEVAFSVGLSLVARKTVQVNLLATTLDGEWSAVVSLGLLRMGPADDRRSQESRQAEELRDETLPY